MSNTIRYEIIKIAEKILEGRGFNAGGLNIEVDIPKEKKFGDFSLNIAMKLARVLKKPPLKIAQDFVSFFEDELKLKKIENKIEKIEIKPPGFINIFLSPEALYEVLRLINKETDNYGKNNFGKNEKILIEFVSANPTGPLSIAHARQAAVGDSLGNIFKFCGYDVKKEYYINDEGNQIRNLGLSLHARYLERLGEKTVFPADGYKGEYLFELADDLIKKVKNKYVKDKSEKAVEFFSNYAAKEILKQINEDLRNFGVRFDNWYSQKNHITSISINTALEELRKKGYIYEKDNAVWFASSKFGDDKDRVVKKSDGAFTYLAPDIAYHKLKFKRNFHKLINIWGPDHHGYINRIKAAVSALGHKKEDLSIIIIQLATLLRGGKPVAMSTRAGEYITLGELLKEVGRDAARFFFLMRCCDSHLEFDLELAKKHTLDNPVYYIQYAYARISGIKKVFKDNFYKQEKDGYKKLFEKTDLSYLNEEEAWELIRKLNHFPDILISCVICLDPQGLTIYLRELAGLLHSFYNKYRVYSPGKENLELSKARFYLVYCIAQVLSTGLKLIGVSAPEEM